MRGPFHLHINIPITSLRHHDVSQIRVPSLHSNPVHPYKYFLYMLNELKTWPRDMSMSGNAPLRVALSFTSETAGPSVETTALHVSCIRGGSSNFSPVSHFLSPVSVNSQGQPSIPLVIAEGLEDGSLLLYHIPEASEDANGSLDLDSDSTPQTGIALTAIRSPTIGTPRGVLSTALSRTSSSSRLHLSAYADSSSKSLSHLHQHGQPPPNQRLRAASATSSASLTSSRIDLTEGLSPYTSSAGQPRISSGITLASVNAELSEPTTADEDVLKAHLRQRAREPVTETSALGLLAGLARRGIEDDRGNLAQQEVQPLLAASAEQSRSTSSLERPVRPPRKFSMDLKRGDTIYAGIEDSLKDDRRMETLLEAIPVNSRHDHTQCPMDEGFLQRDGRTDTPTARIILPGARDNSVIQICDIPGRAQLAILGRRG